MKASIQIYSIREFGDLDAQLALAKQCGFDWIESVATHGLGAAEFAAKVAGHGLRISSMHVGLQALEAEGGVDTIVAACRATACPLVIMPWLPMGERPASGAGWLAVGQRLAVLGRQFKAQGIGFAYHNHEWEFLAYDGRTALDWIFSASEPTTVGWEADIGWVCRSGNNPLALATQYADRLVSVHCKDIALPATAVDEDGWATLGAGVVGWGELFRGLRALKPGLDLFVFEHDKPVHFEATLRGSRNFMRQALGA